LTKYYISLVLEKQRKNLQNVRLLTDEIRKE